MTRPILGILAAVAWIGANAAAGMEKPWHAVRGHALQALLADRDFGDGVHYAYQFHRSGQLTGTNMGNPARGTWKATSEQLCYLWTQPKDEEECYEVEQRGQEVRMLRNGQEILSGHLMPLKSPPGGSMKP